MHFIGIDIGTSSICGVVYDFTSRETTSITQDNHTNIVSSHSWEKAQDATQIIDIVLEIVRQFQSRYPDIRGIGVTGQMHGMVYVDAQGEAVSPLYTWQDNRGNLLCKENLSYAAHLKEVTGHSVSTGFGMVTHFYNTINGLVPEKATKLCTIMDYAVMKLSGRQTPLTDYSNAASLGFFDKRQLQFDTEALEKADIKRAILPEVAASGRMAGSYESIPVYTAIGDNQASFLGSVNDIEHSVHVTVGTSSQISIFTKQYIEIESLDTRPLPGGGYILVGADLCGGCAFSMLNTFFQSTLKFFTDQEISSADLYNAMTAIAYQTNSDQDLIVDTLFDGSRLNPDERGQITQISMSNFTLENLIIGFVKGISQGLYHFYDRLPASIKKDKTLLVGSGNGIKKNPLLCKAFEEKFNRPVRLSPIQEEAALGACICGMVGGNYIERFALFVD